MNICLVSREYPPESGGGGIGTYVYNLAHGLSKYGHSVYVIAYSGQEEKEYLDGKVLVHRIIQKKIKGTWKLSKYIPISNVIYSVEVSRKLTSIIKKYNIEIVEFTNWQAEGLWFLLKKRKIPVITRMSTPYFEIMKIGKISNSLINRISCWLEKIACEKSDILLTHTRAHRETMATAYRLDNNRIKIVHLGILPEDNDHILSDIGKRKNSSSVNILYVSRLEKRKGTKILLSVIPDLLKVSQDINIYLIGKDPNDENRKWFISKYKDIDTARVHFLGYVDKISLEEHYMNCDIFVMPSLYESFGLVYLEAMKYGKPVIGCRVGGIPEIIDSGESGILIPPNDTKALLEALILLITNPDVRIEMGASALRRFKEKFTADIMVSETLKIYEKVYSKYYLKNYIN